MKNTRKNHEMLCLCSLAVTLLLIAATPVAAAPGQCVEARANGTEKLESNAFFESVSTTEVEFRQGVEFEVIQDSDGVWGIRYGFDLQDESLRAVVGDLSCRCDIPSVCPDDTCAVTGQGTGNAKCRGGCYREDGTACVSCKFLAPLPVEN